MMQTLRHCKSAARYSPNPPSSNRLPGRALFRKVVPVLPFNSWVSLAVEKCQDQTKEHVRTFKDRRFSAVSHIRISAGGGHTQATRLNATRPFTACAARVQGSRAKMCPANSRRAAARGRDPDITSAILPNPCLSNPETTGSPPFRA